MKMVRCAFDVWLLRQTRVEILSSGLTDERTIKIRLAEHIINNQPHSTDKHVKSLGREEK
jgi:hypothetical protein